MSEVQKIVVLTESELESVIKRAVAEALKSKPDGHNSQKLLYSIKEAAQLLNVPPSCVGRAAREGRLNSTHLGHYVRFTANNLESYIEKLRSETGEDTGEKRGSKRKRETD